MFKVKYSQQEYRFSCHRRINYNAFGLSRIVNASNVIGESLPVVFADACISSFRNGKIMVRKSQCTESVENLFLRHSDRLAQKRGGRER